MNAFKITVIICLLIGAMASAGDLYSVRVNSRREADLLKSLNVKALLRTDGSYLVFVDGEQSEYLRNSDLDKTLLASDVRRDQLAMDGRLDRKNAENFRVLFEEDQFRLLLVDDGHPKVAGEPVELFELPDIVIEIEYQPAVTPVQPGLTVSALVDLQTLIDRVEQDSLESYVNRLVAFRRRVSGTSSNYAARDWIESKFGEFGYDSVVVDPFTGSRLWERTPCQSYNVFAYKRGTVFPEQQIIIGGHFDAVPECPGADDNASGTAAVLECARILADIETDMSFVFVAFDSEESGLLGAYHYVDGAVERSDDIVVMINVDMIGHFDNSDRADIYSNGQNVYAQRWDLIGNSYVGINADLGGLSASDHWPFQLVGYDVIFVQEKVFSTVYHTEQDTPAYMNFEYMTRMVKATAGMAYSVNSVPPPVRITSLEEPGDGHSFIVNWQTFNPSALAYYELSYYPTSSPADVITLTFGSSETGCILDGLTEGQEYCLSILGYDAFDQTSLKPNYYYFTPRSLPAAPFDIVGMPLKESVSLRWSYNNSELDFDHCAVLRDGVVIAQTLDTFYLDTDATLGSELHDYRVVAVDTDGNYSDTLSTVPLCVKAATLQAGRILAVNRTQIYAVDFVDETRTGEFLRAALDGYDFDYYSDTGAVTCVTDCRNITLNDMVDYGVIVVGAETAWKDDIALSPSVHGILDTLVYYMELGGKVAVFGRWGNVGNLKFFDYMTTSWTYDDAYHDIFHINGRFTTPTLWDYASTYVPADLIGAWPKISTYPDLPWDSIATVAHSASHDSLITDVAGIPCASYVRLDSSEVDIIYGYDSRANDASWDGQPVAWRYFGDDYAYVFFDIPLSFIDRTAAIAALRQAVDELLAGAPAPYETLEGPTDGGVPGTFTLAQNYPNPFNPSTRIDFALPQACRVSLEVFNILGQRVARLVDRDLSPGSYEAHWDGSGVASGLYLYRLRAGEFEQSKKMLLIR